MGVPSFFCFFSVLPKPLVLVMVVLNTIKLLACAPFLYLGLCSRPYVLRRFAAQPLGVVDHAYRLSAEDLPAPPLTSPSPAPASIKRRLRVVQYGDLAATAEVAAAAAEGQGTVCAVCLYGLSAGDEVRELGNCRHAFHRGCIDGWVDRGWVTCPLCRERLLPRGRGRRQLSWPSRAAESVTSLLGYAGALGGGGPGSAS